MYLNTMYAWKKNWQPRKRNRKHLVSLLVLALAVLCLGCVVYSCRMGNILDN